ncbi:short-subunit dehydrogenase [Williamsia limnetica]|uniref:Short-subunit dehydrogenase n=2 Tax=Williamsia limnetica TaxID=882452 RepID=A0A318RIJ4_WILLI|nr:short-subunit dehydrogenase [Williamsia limnetica]
MIGYSPVMTNDTQVRPLALVTGASQGIGFELATLFARDGYDLLVVAEGGSTLDEAVTTLRACGSAVAPVVADLRTEDGVREVYDAVAADGRGLTAAAINAGVGQGGSFVDTPLADTMSVIDLNVRSTVHLTKLVLDDMAARDEGRILLTSSIAATMPGPYQAVYNASKSFVQSFAEALQGELADSAVTLTALMPGPTATNFFHRAGLDDTKMGQSSKDDPAAVARQGYDALLAGKRKVVASSMTSKVMAAADAVLPDAAKAAAHRFMAKPGGGR